MMTEKTPPTDPGTPSEDAPDAPKVRKQDTDRADDAPREIGGRKGPEPTRFGDWEKNGRCIDF